MKASDLLHFVANSQVRPKVLQTASKPMTTAELVSELGHSNRAIEHAVEWYLKHGWFKEQDGHYSQTLIGAAMAHAFADSTPLSREDIEFITYSAARAQLLRSSSLSSSATELARSCDVSAATAHRKMDSLEDRGWFNRQGQLYQRTDEGDIVYTAFARLFDTTEQVIDKNLCLRWLDPSLTGLPIHRLDTARLGVSDSSRTDGWRELFTELIGSDFEQYRGMISHVSNSAADIFRDRLNDGTEAELLVTKNVLRNLPIAGLPAQLVQNGIRAPTFDLLVSPDLPVMLSIFDDDIVFFGPLPMSVEGKESAVLVSADEQVVDWAIDLYECQYDRSQRPSDFVLYSILSKLDPTPRLAGILGR